MEKKVRYKVTNDEYIKVPKNVLENLKYADSTRIKTLLYFLSSEKEEADIENIAKMLLKPEEEIESAFQFWVTVGVLIKNEDIEATIHNKLEMLLKHPPLPYEKQKVTEIIRSTQLPVKIALEIMDIGIEEGKKSSDWVVEVIKVCAKSSNPEESCACYRRYFSLLRKIPEGLGIKKEFTSKERVMIFEWAKNKIPLAYIYNTAERTKNRTNGISIPYMNAIIKKVNPDELFIDDIGY